MCVCVCVCVCVCKGRETPMSIIEGITRNILSVRPILSFISIYAKGKGKR